MKALVTGAKGFAGRHLVEHLIEQGDDVASVDRSVGDPDVRDLERLLDFVAEIRPDVVYHLAAQADVGGSWTGSRDTFDVNLNGTLTVLEVCRRIGVATIVAVTSADIYGDIDPANLPLDEATPLRPVSPYAVSKAAADLACLQAHLGYHQRVIRARAFNHLGPGQRPQFVASALAHRVAEAEIDRTTTVRIGNLSARRDFTDVRDVVRAYRLLAQHGEPGEAYNVCTGQDVAINELAERLTALATIELELEVDPALYRPVDLPVLRGDCTKLRAVTGWTPRYSLDQTLTDLLDDARWATRSER